MYENIMKVKGKKNWFLVTYIQNETNKLMPKVTEKPTYKFLELIRADENLQGWQVMELLEKENVVYHDNYGYYHFTYDFIKTRI